LFCVTITILIIEKRQKKKQNYGSILPQPFAFLKALARKETPETIRAGTMFGSNQTLALLIFT
jgi:hypothetical protein